MTSSGRTPVRAKRFAAIRLWARLALLAPLLSGCIGFHRHQVGEDMLDDKVTNDRVQAALKADGTGRYAGIQVGTTNGIVTLSGSVRTEEEKSKAVELAKTVRRVKELKDAIQVKQ